MLELSTLDVSFSLACCHYYKSIIYLPEPAQISMIDSLDRPFNGAVVLGEVGVAGKVWRQ